VWLSGGKENNWAFKLYIFMGKGGSPRKFEEMPVKLTKKEVHHFQLAPSTYDSSEAILWGKVKAAGGDERMVKAIMESRIYRSFGGDRYPSTKMWPFWETILKFFCEQQMMDPNLVAPICDYIHHIKYENRQIPRPGGGWQVLPPENTNFKINGRTMQALIRGMEAWHKETHGKRANAPRNWDGLDIPDYVISFGKDEKKRTYSFTQLRSASALRIEGRTHGHCVAGYVNSCNSGRTSIWSMYVEDFTSLRKNLLTIEVTPQRMIVQCRGKANRLANANEWRIVERFAVDRNLDIARYVSHN
jgi:hypothetical protein